MDCDTFLEGKVIEIEELTNSILLRIDFGKFKNKYKLKKSDCDIYQLLTLKIGSSVTCLLNGTDNLIRIFANPPLYYKKQKRFSGLRKFKLKS